MGAAPRGLPVSRRGAPHRNAVPRGAPHRPALHRGTERRAHGTAWGRPAPTPRATRDPRRPPRPPPRPARLWLRARCRPPRRVPPGAAGSLPTSEPGAGPRRNCRAVRGGAGPWEHHGGPGAGAAPPGAAGGTGGRGQPAGGHQLVRERRRGSRLGRAAGPGGGFRGAPGPRTWVGLRAPGAAGTERRPRGRGVGTGNRRRGAAAGRMTGGGPSSARCPRGARNAPPPPPAWNRGRSPPRPRVGAPRAPPFPPPVAQRCRPGRPPVSALRSVRDRCPLPAARPPSAPGREVAPPGGPPGAGVGTRGGGHGASRRSIVPGRMTAALPRIEAGGGRGAG